MSPQDLPNHLRERTRAQDPARTHVKGRFVLYWMHHAVRDHENPALDTATCVAAELDLPLLVYQGLGGRHRFNADRHHAFILQGAQETHQRLCQRGVRAVFHLPEDPALPSPLSTLAEDAALVVAEDYPAPPFPAWTRRLAARVDTPIWLVDASCVVPMGLPGRRFARAFEFRKAISGELTARIAAAWPRQGALPPWFDRPLPFAPLDWDAEEIADLCARCVIDHDLPPVAHTPGGSTAGYARWDAFKGAGLRSYHRLRNDAAVAWPHGVSRMSPYLHHGHVSPLRLAREAHAACGEGADKFLDELIVWRELAFNFCFHTPDPESLAALPSWARQTLDEHTPDRRPRLLDLERLASAESGDPLWEAAQRSLLVHGELHNNLRMTWAKALLRWRAGPGEALEALIDLNHRYALDGNDPASYGGLLWALGLFDRPFTPEQPILGTVRGRSTKDHARRLDLPRYRERVERPSAGVRARIAVIGAGLSGLAAARALHDQGHQVTVFEKSRGRGGRLATRRLETGAAPISWDHGAQYFAARDPRFWRRVDAWSERGLVAPWDAALANWDGESLSPRPTSELLWVGVPGMSGLASGLAEGLDLRSATRVLPPLRVADHWVLSDASGADLGRFDQVLVAVPSPQAAELLAAVPALAERAAAVQYDPCWTLMLALDGPVETPFQGVFSHQGPLGWLARNGSKPGRGGEAWVCQASPDWSREWLGGEVPEVQGLLEDAWREIIGPHGQAVIARQCHRWLYARVAEPLGEPCLWDADLGIGACGDWCQGARVESAWLSGIALAGRALGTLSTSAAPVR